MSHDWVGSKDVQEVHIKDHAVVTNIDGDIQHAHNFNLIMDTIISGPVPLHHPKRTGQSVNMM